MAGNAVLLWICQGLFILRITGQIIVALYSPARLPPMEEWYSDLIPYPVLLPIQTIMVIFMTKISWDNTKKAGCFYVTELKTKRILTVISFLYFLAMLIRYIFNIALIPENRWFKGAIPIVFHWVLAAYIYLLALNAPKKEISPTPGVAAGN